MAISNKRQLNCDAFNRKRLKYFSYEEEFYSQDVSSCGNRDVDKVHSIYLLIGGLLLIASLCILGYDLFLQTTHDGIRTIEYERHEQNAEYRRHNNTPASTLSSTPPVLAPMEYWL